MTRDEAIKMFRENACKLPLETIPTSELVHRIYDDFKSETCNNCKFYQKEVCCNSDSLLCTEFTSAEFGCIEFVRTKND